MGDPVVAIPIPKGQIDEFFQIYRLMQRTRRIEQRLMAEYHPANQMRCPIHFCVGQESMPGVLSRVLRPDDVLMTHYRSHGYFLAKGGDLAAMVAEFYGRDTGTNRGLAGSMELGSHDIHFFSGAIVGGTTVIPLGAAFAHKFRGTDGMAVAVMGDGSFDEGAVYESLNIAALHGLPLLVICENNAYAAHTPLAKRLGRPEILVKAEAMGVPGRKVDGSDLLALAEAVREAEASIRAGKGPRFLEVETYRHCAHVGPEDDASLNYREAAEIDSWKARDPLPALRAALVAAGRSLDETDSAIEAEVEAAILAAKAAPFPTAELAHPAQCLSGTYAAAAQAILRDDVWDFKAGQAETVPGPF